MRWWRWWWWDASIHIESRARTPIHRGLATLEPAMKDSGDEGKEDKLGGAREEAHPPKGGEGATLEGQGGSAGVGASLRGPGLWDGVEA